jgi:hypothetical protein
MPASVDLRHYGISAKATADVREAATNGQQQREWLRRLMNEPATFPPYSIMESSIGVAPRDLFRRLTQSLLLSTYALFVSRHQCSNAREMATQSIQISSLRQFVCGYSLPTLP